MKQKPDETLDSWVRQSLRQLPDTAPPDSSFDSERLWAQLRPELQTTSSRRKSRVVWWAAAACLSGLVLSWFVWQHHAARQSVATTYHYKPQMPITQAEKARSTNDVAPAELVLTEKPISKNIQQATGRQVIISKISPDAALVQESLIQKIVVTMPDSTTAAIDIPVISEKPAEQSRPNVALAKPQRRFRLVHENELRAEEEAAPKLYRIDHFVRIGTGRTNASDAETHSVEPPLSLTTKKSQ